ncbi:RagB/SusD family nutrient uptake outer membrane protein [Flavitalea sp. BT771]|uniref:RagB/SusD family nutrient uptake outer membrane protein n=1 Tax=Flavitalea sp. BT771 TaxID=3063329 RepID=UPI0026E124DD|nr:RagB/SusD family nutrient uptake outer membrane protein [Flavitalea sp. BT771]MDO6429143.1 RagB/SusD family nutrient uptake outer membrane protein [Flavitalea sp. BT771]MDV6218729.1 RagB/SusD family nutrient uptake outer membrane protein [Flavitalea sp. BT771]
MKKLLYIPTIVFVFLLASSCNKKLEVLPQNNATPDQIKTSADVQALLFGAYEQLQSYSAFGEQFMLIPDLLASKDQVDWVGTYASYKQVKNKKIVASNSIASSMWGNGYKVIGICNTVLDKLSVVDSADKATVEGEALFMRGTIYFELLGIYARPFSDGNAATNPGLPIVLVPTYKYDSTKGKPARATVAATYTQIISDLQGAIAKLPSSNGSFRADVYSAKAILSRVYLSMLDYANAATQANDVIVSKNFTLTDTYDKAFNNSVNSTEDIFAIQQTSQSNVGTSNQGLSTFYAPNQGLPVGQTVGRGDAQIDAGYIVYFEAGDRRASFVTVGKSIAGADGTYPNKWQQFYKAMPVVRLAEMYLTRGEANLLSGGSVGGVDPLDDINTVRARSGASLLATVTGQDFVDERFRELGFEGDRFWTLKRLKLNVDGFGYDDNKVIMPLPQSELDVNANLKQNQ